MPYLLDTKIKVKFNGIKINTERQLFEGKLVTSYDKTEKNVMIAREELRKITEDVKTILTLSKEVVQTIEKAVTQGFLSKEEYEGLKDKNRKNTEQSKAILAEMKRQNVLTEAEYAEKVQELDNNQSCLENSDCITQNKSTALVNKPLTAGYGMSFELQDFFILNDDCTERMNRCKTNIDQTSESLAEISERKVGYYTNSESNIRRDEFNVVINIENIDILGKPSKDPPVKNGQFIGEISIGSNEDNSNYIWNGELWSKVIDKGNGKYSSIIYGKNNSRFYLEVSWSEDDSMETISIKVLRAKNGASFTEGIIEHHDILMTSLGLPASAFTPIQGAKNIQYRAKIKTNTNIVSKNYTPVKFRGITYTKPDASRINFANGTTDFTPLNKSGNPVQAGWKHISEGHFNREIAHSRSVFTKSEDKIKKLIQQKSVINTPLVEVQPGIYKRAANLNEIVGKTALKFGGKETSWVEIFTDVKGNIITAYPVPAP